MGLVFGSVQYSRIGLVKATEWFNEVLDHPLVRRKAARTPLPPPTPTPVGGWGDLIDEGPDDIWPADTADLGGQEPEVLIGEQWGLQLPNGEVSWNMYQGTHLNNPIDRVQMIARIQKTALDAGFTLDEFLTRYHWVTRKQIASVTYEGLTTYSLLNPEATAAPPSSTPVGGTEEGS